MIDTEALRKKVIDLAIQGKLTEQLPSDGDAEALYAQILDHKSQLIKEGKIKKDKALPDIAADEIPFEVPENWKWIRFGELMWNRDSERIPVSVEDRKKLKKIYDYYGASGVIDKVEGYLFDTKLLLIGEDGANLLGRSTPIAFLAEGKYWVNNHAHVLGFYLYDYLDFVMHYINSISLVPYVTGTAQPKLNQDNMNKIPVPLPPLAEQKRIVEKIEDILSQIDIIDDLQAKYSNDLAVLKSKIIDAGIQGKLTEQLPEDGDAEDLYAEILNQKLQLIKEGKLKKEKPLPDIAEDEISFELPKNWKWVRLGSCINLLSGQDYSSNDYNADGIGMPYMTGASNIENETMVVNRWTEKPKNISHQGDLLLVCKGSGYGKTAFNNVGDVHIARQFMAISSPYGISLKFVNYVLKNCINLIKDSGQGIIPGIDRKSVLGILLPLPPIEEQKRIVSKIDELIGIVAK